MLASMNKLSSLCLAALAALPATLASADAHACGGGFFAPATEVDTTSLTAHRVVVSISQKQTVIWDQVRYSGDPSQFAWVYPVKAGAELQVGNDAWIEALDAYTTPRVAAPELLCPGSEAGCGCGSAAKDGNGGFGGGDVGGRGGVTVKHEGSVGPYDTKTISSTTPGAIAAWLTQNGFSIPSAAAPVLDDYSTAGFDFIAVRLQPGKGVDSMQPLRVVMPGAQTTFPLKMLSAGTTDKVDIALFVISEGRLDVGGSFSQATIDAKKLSWDFDAGKSNYESLRTSALAGNGGKTWLTTAAKKGALLTSSADNDQVLLSDSVSTAGTILQGYVLQGKLDGVPTACDTNITTAVGLAGSTAEVTDASVFACGTLDDASTALLGMHPADVWVTRLEASLPLAALGEDLVLVPASGEVPVTLTARTFTNPYCEDATLAANTPMQRFSPTGAPIAAFAIGLVLAGARRRRR
jgi:hypothetical protein